ncbi:MAG: hypothetical protein FJ386_01780 [Verrucomicrobia bacterium]|nr:hypothetical protein [Verrucomicrobiota bacterium]
MKKKTLPIVAASAALFLGVLVTSDYAADAKSPIKEAMQKYHKGATKDADPVCKKASNGAASKDEIKGMLAAYQAMAKAKPPQGDEKSWADKCAALVAAATALDKGEAGAVDKYKAAVNCKACHEVHRPAAKKK